MKIRTADEDFRRQFWQLYKERLYLIPQQLAHELNCTQVLINRLREETTCGAPSRNSSRGRGGG